MNTCIVITPIETRDGGSALETAYIMKHSRGGKINRYRVTCQLEGLQTLTPYLCPVTATLINSEENNGTVSEDVAIRLFEQMIPGPNYGFPKPGPSSPDTPKGKRKAKK